MSRRLKTGLAEWVPSKDLTVIAKLCEFFNQGRVYEIVWEYCGLTAGILSKRHVYAWLYRENGKLSGFALGRLRRGIMGIEEVFVFEEIWGPCDGTSNELGQLSRQDMERALQFKKLVNSLNFQFPILLRAATDNQFAHLIARTLRANWVNGLVIAGRTLNNEVEFSTPAGYKLRNFEDGDQFYMSKIHKEAFRQIFPPNDYKTWATAANCRSIVVTHHGEPVGFLIAEKRSCGSLGDFTIAVKPIHQGKGIGSALLKAAFNVFVDTGVRKVIADYLMLNTSACRLYQKHKFRPERIYNYFLFEQET